MSKPTPEQIYVLRELAAACKSHPRQWFRPMDIGARYTSRILIQLHKRGLVKRINGGAALSRMHYLYRITDAGLVVLAEQPQGKADTK